MLLILLLSVAALRMLITVHDLLAGRLRLRVARVVTVRVVFVLAHLLLGLLLLVEFLVGGLDLGLGEPRVVLKRPVCCIDRVELRLAHWIVTARSNFQIILLRDGP